MNTGELQVKAYELRSKTSKELLKVPSGISKQADSVGMDGFWMY